MRQHVAVSSLRFTALPLPVRILDEGKHGGEQQARRCVGKEECLEGRRVLRAGADDCGGNRGADAQRCILSGEVDRERALLRDRIRGEPGDHCGKVENIGTHNAP